MHGPCARHASRAVADGPGRSATLGTDTRTRQNIGMARIILVDDEPTIRRNLAKYLTLQGHDVEAVENGVQALRAFDDGDVDLVITDINMPEMDGIEILAALRSRGSDVPVIAMSGGGQFDKRLLLTSATMLGAVTTLEKPFELDELAQAVNGLLAG